MTGNGFFAGAISKVDWVQADFDRKLAAIFLEAVEIPPDGRATGLAKKDASSRG